MSASLYSTSNAKRNSLFRSLPIHGKKVLRVTVSSSLKKLYYQCKNQSKLLTGEATPSYLFQPLVAEAIKQYAPDIKIIAFLRDPISRAYSHYQHMRRAKRESLSFEEAIREELRRLDLLNSQKNPIREFKSLDYTYLSRGRYAEQLKVYFPLFPKNQILVIKSEDFFGNPSGSYRECLFFLKLRPHELPSYRVATAGKYEEEINFDTRKRLETYFRPHNQELNSILGVDMAWET